MNILRSLAVVIVALGSVSVAHAAPITFTFTGSIPLDGGVDPRGSGGGCGPQGAATSLCGTDVFGYMTIDSEPARVGFSPEYTSFGFPYGMVIVADGAVGVFDFLNIWVANDSNSALADCPPCDFLLVEAFGSAGFLRGFFFDPEGDAIDNDFLFPDPGLFDWGCTELVEGCGLQIGDARAQWCCEFNWKFEQSPFVIPVLPVLEPSTFALLGLGIAGMGLACRRKTTQVKLP